MVGPKIKKTLIAAVSAGVAIATPILIRDSDTGARSPSGFRSAEKVELRESEQTVTVRIDSSQPYELKIKRGPFQMKVAASGRDLVSAANLKVQVPHPEEDAVIKAREKMKKDSPDQELPPIPERWIAENAVLREFRLDGTRLHLMLESETPGIRYDLDVKLGQDRIRYVVKTRSEVPEFRQLQVCHDIKSTGHWYGHGEVDHRRQPWPLSSGEFSEEIFSPSNYKQIEPFWYSSHGAGIVYDENHPIEVRGNRENSGLLCIGSRGRHSLGFTYTVARNAPETFMKYMSLVGPAHKSQAAFAHFELPVWNTWAQFYTGVDQQKVLIYASDLERLSLNGHSLQIDDRWESNYGNLAFDPEKFPDPVEMSRQIHEKGLRLGVWVTLWMNIDSTGFKEAEKLGYLLKNRERPEETCVVEWWNGEAGIVDLGNRRAFTWFQEKLSRLMKVYGIDGFKFDTRFFDDSCSPYPGTKSEDYLELGAKLASGYDLQGVGVRLSWKAQKHGFITRQLDKPTDWDGLRTAVRQNLAISTIGYPFVTSDMIGGSLGDPPPDEKVLVRWAQAAALMPVMYSSTSPTVVTQSWSKITRRYSESSARHYREAIRLHQGLAPYIWRQVKKAEGTGYPIMRPLFFDYPDDERTYTVDDQWMLGDLILAAPLLGPDDVREIFVPAGTWWDTLRKRKITGPAHLKKYRTSMEEVPFFVRVDDESASGLQELKHYY